MILAAFLLLAFTSNLSLAYEGKCANADRCCLGRDSSCVVNGLQADGEVVADPCYCDEGCLETGDCCSDYQQVCNIQLIDCQLSAWSEWSGCDRSCGKGVQSRTRVIIQHPSPGRPPCDALEQKRGCLGSRCSARYRKYRSPIRETAGLLPAKYFQQRYKPDWEVRQNLFEHQKNSKPATHWDHVQSNQIDDGYQADQPYSTASANTNNAHEYCIVFELAKVTKACKRDKDFYKMDKGQQMCALCPSDAQRESLGGRCKGHGVDSHLTRWRSTVKPKCHGKWRRVSEMQNCPCRQGPDYVFV